MFPINRLSQYNPASAQWVEDAETSNASIVESQFASHCFLDYTHEQRDLLVSDNPAELAATFASFAKEISDRVETDMRVSILEKVVLELRHSIAELASRQTITVPIFSLAPEPFSLRQPIHVVVQPEGEEFSATFFDANINASGDTQTDAVENLKEVLVNTYRRYTDLGIKRLGPGPRKQFAVLQTLFR